MWFIYKNLKDFRGSGKTYLRSNHLKKDERSGQAFNCIKYLQ